MSNTKKNAYDEIKGMLKTIRTLNESYQLRQIQEQEEIGSEFTGDNISNDVTNEPDGDEKKGFNVINGVEVVINSTDQMDQDLSEDEKGKISQIIDDFKSEISELVEFNKLQVYDDSAKLDGIITNTNLTFMFSAGDDTGAYITNVSLLKLSDEVLDTIIKLKEFSNKFAATIDDLISNRRMN